MLAWGLAAGSPTESTCRSSLDGGGHGSRSVEGSGAGVGLAWICLGVCAPALGHTLQFWYSDPCQPLHQRPETTPAGIRSRHHEGLLTLRMIHENSTQHPEAESLLAWSRIITGSSHRTDLFAMSFLAVEANACGGVQRKRNREQAAASLQDCCGTLAKHPEVSSSKGPRQCP